MVDLYIMHFVVLFAGHGSMGISNSIGSNTFDILLCLGLPWFIKATFMPTLQDKHWVNSYLYPLSPFKGTFLPGWNKFCRNRIQRHILAVLAAYAVRRLRPKQIQTGQESRTRVPPDVRCFLSFSVANRTQRFL